MRIFFRADASVEMGTGHVMRCLSLADALKKKGVRSIFLCRPGPGDLCGWIQRNGYPVRRLARKDSRKPGREPLAHSAWLGTSQEEDARQTLRRLSDADAGRDWLVVDHYAIDHRWHAQIRPLVHRLLAIDDLADRRFDCDVLLDQNLPDASKAAYGRLAPRGCRKLLGPRFALLRGEFIRARRKGLRRPAREVRKLLIFFGGADPDNRTGIALKALNGLAAIRFKTTVLVGPSNPHAAKVKVQARAVQGARCLQSAAGMASLLRETDLALGATGTSVWERSCLGVPSIVTSIAANQEPLLRAADRAGIVQGISARKFNASSVRACLERLLEDPARRAAMSTKGRKLVDGRGAERVADIITGKETK